MNLSKIPLKSNIIVLRLGPLALVYKVDENGGLDLIPNNRLKLNEKLFVLLVFTLVC